jgi:hypothetical protein
VTTPDAVVVHGLFGVNIETLFSIFRFAVTLLILYFTIRIPFKRSFHWAFMAFNSRGSVKAPRPHPTMLFILNKSHSVEVNPVQLSNGSDSDGISPVYFIR